MGIEFGISIERVHWLLTAGVFLSALACMSARMVGHRFGQSRALLGALALLAATLLVHGWFPTALMFVVNLAVLQLCWNFIDIFQLGTLAVVDPSGRAAALVPRRRRVRPSLPVRPRRACYWGLGRATPASCSWPDPPRRWRPHLWHRASLLDRTGRGAATGRRVGLGPRMPPSAPMNSTQARRRIDAVLSLADGHLWIEACDTVALAAEYGTRCTSSRRRSCAANSRRLRASFERCWDVGPVELLPSLKANYTIAVRQILNDEGLGCDVFGHGELQAALWPAFPAGKYRSMGRQRARR